MAEGFQHIITKVETSVGNISTVLDSLLQDIEYKDLSTEDKAKYDLFLAYSLNSCLWMYLRMNGQDPSQTVIKTELNKVRELIAELQHTIDRKTIMPRIDQGAAKRFVKHGLWVPNQSESKAKHKRFDE